jgi:predicted enzyme related to lactoylglutathione lyase
MTNPSGSFCWFECGTTDAAAAKNFYTKLFGWTAVDVPMPGVEGPPYTLLKVGEADIAGLYELAGPMFEGMPSHWVTYVGVDDADATAARAETLGGAVVQGPMDVPGVGRIAFVRDPSGADIAVFQPGEHRGTDPEKTNLGWSELHTPDTEAAKAFYCELFDWGAKEDASGQYTEFQLNGRSIGGMMEIPSAQRAFRPAHWLPYAMVEDCDATMAKAGKLGAKVLMPARDIEHVGRFAVLADPTGATIAVIKLEHHGKAS